LPDFSFPGPTGGGYVWVALVVSDLFISAASPALSGDSSLIALARHQIRAAKRMSMFAVCLNCIFGSWTYAAQDIDRRGYRLKVGRIYTKSIAAEMVDV
jgi:hypothetical protein